MREQEASSRFVKHSHNTSISLKIGMVALKKRNLDKKAEAHLGELVSSPN
jgi:hypothetical protein